MSSLRLLRENDAVRKLWAAQAISVAGDWLSTVALMSLIYIGSGSSLRVGLALVASTLPALVLSPWVGQLADNLDEKQLLIAADLARAALAIALALFSDSFWAIIILKAGFSIATGLFTPARQRLLLRIVAGDELLAANSLTSTTWGIMAVVGASVGGVLADAMSPFTLFALDAATFLASAWFLVRMTVRNRPKSDAGRPIRGDSVVRQAFHHIVRQPVVSLVVLSGCSWGAVGGAYLVLLTIYGAEVYDAGSFGIGFLHGIQGLGIAVGGLLAATLAHRTRIPALAMFSISYTGQALAFVVFLSTDNLVAGGAALLLMRVLSGVVIPLDSTLLQQHTPSNLIGKVVALHTAVYGSLMQVSIFLAGLLVEHYPADLVGYGFAGIGLAGSAGCLVFVLRPGGLVRLAGPKGIHVAVNRRAS